MLLDKQADGLIISTTLNNTKNIAWLKEANFPFVLIDRKIDTLKTNYVGVDNIQGAFEAVNHLIKTGHKKIAHLTLNTSHLSSLKERITGYKNALKHNQIKFKPELIKEVDFDNILNDTKVVLKELLNPPYSIDAIFTANNNLTVACLEVLNELKIRIPQDVALVGFDDIEAFKLSYPPVTTVVQPIFKMSQYAVDILIDNIKNTEKFVIKQKQFENRLEIRKSCGYKHKAPKI
jgi:LacI family transcriptional regulator